MKYIRLAASSNTYFTREPEEGDEWDRGNTTTEWFFGGLYLDDKDSHEHTIPVKGGRFKRGDLCYVVVVVWSSGDSFGLDRGKYMELMDVFEVREDAEALKKRYEEGPSAGLPWDGYFESLDYVNIVHGVLG